MENDILIQEYEKKLADIQSNFDAYKKDMEANLLALKEENKNEIEKINARYREELRSVLSARNNPEKKPDAENGNVENDDIDEDTHDSRIKHAINKLKSKYKIGD